MGGDAARVARVVMVFIWTLLLSHHVNADLRDMCSTAGSGGKRECPAQAEACSTDDQCPFDKICCDTQCGNACVEPLLTGCENIRLSSERISRALVAENSRGGRGVLRGVRVPKCRASDGEFEEVQCDNEVVSTCWCVDHAGLEISGTRAPAAALVNCTKTAPCAAHTCRMLCPLGFELDARGCPLCKCRDPCTTITCPGQLSCQLEEKNCLRPPCPPVPTCKRGRSLQNICPVGEPLLISETSRPFLCGVDPGKPNCPPLYRCLVEKGNDYGVCCPASLELQKAGTCPNPASFGDADCGTPCAHDLECPSMQKCCDGGECGKHCTLPHNVTACTQQKMLAELLVVSEMEGRGYVPQCSADGGFNSRQCSRNGLVCWCVDSEGNKLRGSMGPSAAVACPAQPTPARSSGRSLSSDSGAGCARALCAGVCEYGYRAGTDGCATCECDDPCEGYACGRGMECVRAKDKDCTGELCTGVPVCRPKVSYENPCSSGAPATDDTGEALGCGADADCPDGHACTSARKAAAVCCPSIDEPYNSTDVELLATVVSCGPEAEALCGMNNTDSCSDGICEEGLVCCTTSSCGSICLDPAKMRLQTDNVDATPTMCEYLRDFDEKMEGTVDGMRLALPAPTCLEDGAYTPRQCAGQRCWCVDSFGTEIPDTRVDNSSTLDCVKVRTDLSCLDATCRMGCDYGFELGANKCPQCRCRDPCAGVECPEGRTCAVVDVACDADYCPPVPACLPKKPGQCPYLVPPNGACEWACRSDAECGAGSRCCATGCGTACARALHQTSCQQRRSLALHALAESGQPPSATWIPACHDNGTYNRIQCRDQLCWCVNSAGNEIPGTRATNSTPACDSPTPCPPVECGMDTQCPHGRLLNERGCPTCQCNDPCLDARCRPDETCELVPLECEMPREQCGAVGRCSPAPACPVGAPLMAPDGSGALPCGPSAAACPSTHACRFAPHDSAPPVCCPKPRTVCFESRDAGQCEDGGKLNATRWHFNHERNRCERFTYHGCSGNHNNFKTKEECNTVCPVKEQMSTFIIPTTLLPQEEVLSPCERLREKNEQSAEKYGKVTFVPACDSSGAWEPMQCMQHIDVCWCVSGRGDPLKGSLVRGAKPTCNFRQARKWLQRDPNDEKTRADEILEELIRQMTVYRIDQFEEIDEEVDNAQLEPSENEEIQHENKIIESDKLPNRDLEIQPIRNKNDMLDVELDKSIQSQKEMKKREHDENNMEIDEKAKSLKSGMEIPLLRDEIIEPKEAKNTKNNIDKPLEVSTDKIVFKTKCQLMKEDIENGGDGVRPRCLADGSFSPRQCSRGRCWCVDAAGHRRPHPTVVRDVPEPDPCEVTQVESASLELELVGTGVGAVAGAAEGRRAALAAMLASLGARVPVAMTRDRVGVTLRAQLAGPHAADIVYHVENVVKEEKLSGLRNENSSSVLGADVIRSEYRLATLTSTMQQREILTESTVSATTSYHTALIVLAATSAFIISVMCVLVMLYRARLQREPQHKAERFLPPAPPVYVLSADEKAELARVLHAPPPPVPPAQPHTQPDTDHTRV